MSKTKQNTGKGAAKLAKSSTEGLRSTAAAAPKPAKKPTTKVGRECVRAMEQLRDALALTKPIHDRALAAAVRKERVRCVKILADDFGTLNPGRVSVTIAKIRSGQ